MTLRPIAPALIAALLALALVTLANGPRTASAHPLGNFSINRLLIADLQESGLLYVHYVVDSAEIPTFQRISSLDTNGDREVSETEADAFLAKESPKLLGNIHVLIDGRPAKLAATGGTVELVEGQHVQIRGAQFDIVGRVEQVFPGGNRVPAFDAAVGFASSARRNELHEPVGRRGTHGIGIEIAFRAYDGQDQARTHAVLLREAVHQRAVFLRLFVGEI